MQKYSAKKEKIWFVKYFRDEWLHCAFTYAEVSALMEHESPEDFVGACVPPTSNAIERQNLTQNMVRFLRVLSCIHRPSIALHVNPPSHPECKRT